MLKIYSTEQARRTILRRVPLSLAAFPESVVQRTESEFGPGVTPPEAVRRILAGVREEGDAAVRRWSQKFDGYSGETFAVSAEEMERAEAALPRARREALELAIERIRAFHQKQKFKDWHMPAPGGVIGQRITPVQRVGVYVPSGSAPLPSSLLMSAIPAQAAGVDEIIVCTPPPADGTILAAAHLCGVQTVLQIGGAQAIAALAFGTESVPRVDKIVGAGNLFVTLAKQQLFGVVGLDGLAGPTETMILADDTARPEWVAADLLAQAEHDILAAAVLLTPSQRLAEAVQQAVQRRLPDLSRREIITQALESRGGIVLVPDLESAAALANEFAPEHLCLSVAGPEALAGRIRHAGGLFLGEHSYEVLGDYVAGPSHVMPTGGTARFASPLNVLDFVKITSIIAVDAATGRELSRAAAEIARAEALTAHAAAATTRAEAKDA